MNCTVSSKECKWMSRVRHLSILPYFSLFSLTANWLQNLIHYCNFYNSSLVRSESCLNRSHHLNSLPRMDKLIQVQYLGSVFLWCNMICSIFFFYLSIALSCDYHSESQVVTQFLCLGPHAKILVIVAYKSNPLLRLKGVNYLMIATW